MFGTSESLRLLKTVGELRAAANAHRSAGHSIGVVPTMGALHSGHASLMAEAHRHADTVLVTIFVNPTQFGPGEDLERYPRQLESDMDRCRSAGVHAVFAPSAAEMYPPGERTRVRVSDLTDHLCGATRPGHFEGVATIVTKLLSAVGPCTAVFGKKDYQQLKVVERLVKDLMLPVMIVPAPIVRADDGLALSSRNAYLDRAERQRALGLVRGLSAAAQRFAAGERGVHNLRSLAEGMLREASLEIEYVSVADPETLEPLHEASPVEGSALLALAARVGHTRLIDNLVLGVDPDPLARRSTRPTRA